MAINQAVEAACTPKRVANTLTTGAYRTYDWIVPFVENNAGGLGSAMGIEEADLLT